MRFFKKFIPLVLAVCLALTVPFAAACQDKKKAERGYMFTVKYPDGNVVNGETDSGGKKNTMVNIRLIDGSGNAVTDELTGNDYVPLSKNGGANYMCDRGVYSLVIINCPHGYNLKDFKTDAKTAAYTVSLASNRVNYTATATYKDGTPAAGVELKLMSGSTPLKATSNAQGKATFAETDAGVYDVTATCPDGFTAKTGRTSLSSTEVAIVLQPYSSLSLDAPMSTEELDEMSDEYNDSFFPDLFKPELGAYRFSANVPAGDEIYFGLVPEFSASYNFYVHSADKKKRGNYRIKFYGDTIDTASDSTVEKGSGTGRQTIAMTAGKTYFFSCTSTDGGAAAFDFVISLPDFSREKFEVTSPGSYTVDFRATEQFLSFTPEFSGKYDIYTTGDLDTKINLCDKSDNPIIGEAVDGGGDGMNFKYTLEVKDSYLRNNYVFRLYIAKPDGSEFDDIYNNPQKVNLVIVRTGNADPDESIVIETVKSENNAIFTESGTFVWMPVDGSIEPYIGESGDGIWYVKVNGVEKKLLMAVSKNICSRPDLHKEYAGESFSFADIEYRGDSGDRDDGSGADPNQKKNSNLTVYNDILATSKRLDYSELIAHYSGYVDGKKGDGGICNADGVYPVNDELHGFLTRFFAAKLNSEHSPVYNANGVMLLSMFVDNYNSPSEVRFGYEWLVACGYYA